MNIENVINCWIVEKFTKRDAIWLAVSTELSYTGACCESLGIVRKLRNHNGAQEGYILTEDGYTRLADLIWSNVSWEQIKASIDRSYDADGMMT